MTKQQRFLASEVPLAPAENCLFHVIPVPYEASVSYGGGTALGPQAILDASYQLELWNGRNCPGQEGIFTWPAVDCSGGPEEVIPRIEAATAAALERGPLRVIPVLLGGEHSLTLGALRALRKRYGVFGILHFDAHGDLRPEYEGSIYSHASVMHRAVNDLGLPLFQVGVRSLCLEEEEYRQEKNIGRLDARTLGKNPEAARSAALPQDFPRQIFLSFDVDALDSSIMPATGTPEPGGLSWWQALNLAEKLLEGRELIGLDVVELAPVEALHAPNYTAARLCYELMGLALPSKNS